MKNWGDIKGQDNAVRLLTGSLRTGRVSQSYLFWGPEGVGRSIAAERYILELFKKGRDVDEVRLGRQISQHAHPDLIWIEPAKMKAVKISVVRNIIEKLNLKPYQAPLSVAVIEKAHLLTPGAANALLKILEEPPEASMLILISDKKELLLPTVLSRTTQVRFGGLSDEMTYDIIRGRFENVQEDELRLLARFSQGSPGRALRYREEGVLERQKKVVENLQNAVKAGDAQLSIWDEEDRTRLAEDVELLIMFLRESAVSKEGGEDLLSGNISGEKMTDLFSGLSASEMYEKLTDLVKAKEAIASNCNTKLLAQILPGLALGDTSE